MIRNEKKAIEELTQQFIKENGMPEELARENAILLYSMSRDVIEVDDDGNEYDYDPQKDG